MNKKRVRKIQYCGYGNIITRGYVKDKRRITIEHPTKGTLGRLGDLSYNDEIEVTLIFAGRNPDVFFLRKASTIAKAKGE